MASRALVLGGGGPVGVGWEAGLAAGFEEQGVRLADADLIVGTSAGAIIGSQLALGRTARELFEAQMTLDDRPEMGPVRRSIDLTPLLPVLAKIYTSDMPRDELRRELGALALSTETISEEESLATFGRRTANLLDRWPERGFVCTAVDAALGTLTTWSTDSGVSIGLAVASSCAVPGIMPPVTINGHRYMDGGMGSMTNAELALGYDTVLVVSVTPMRARPGREDVVARMRSRFESELDLLREGGAAVETIMPDLDSLAAFGPNLMDGTRRKEVAQAGLLQGRAETERLREFWR